MTKNDAYERGRIMFERGGRDLPTWDTDFTKTLTPSPGTTVRELLDAWTCGWTIASLDTENNDWAEEENIALIAARIVE